jgi:pilus assembly protein CpaB
MRLRRGWIWYLAGLLLAVVAGVIAVVALRQAVPTAEAPRQVTRPVIVAAKDIGARQVVPLDALEAHDVSIQDIPSGAIFRVEDAAGRFALQPVATGEPLLAQNLVAPPSGPGSTITSTVALAALLPDDKVAVALPADELLGKSGDVGIGDHIDVIGTLVVVGTEEGEAGQVTLMNLQNVPVVKVLEEIDTSSSGGDASKARRKVTGLVLAVDPQDAVILRYFVDANARISVDLRSPKLESVFDVVPVTINYLSDKYGIQVPRPVE